MLLRRVGRLLGDIVVTTGTAAACFLGVTWMDPPTSDDEASSR